MSSYGGGNAHGHQNDAAYAGTNNAGGFTNSLYSAFGGIMRRLSSEPSGSFPTQSYDHDGHASTHFHNYNHNNGIDGVYTPPTITRQPSPLLLRPPPLEPLVLTGFAADTPTSARLLTPAVAEEIRIMVPERLRIEETWRLAYSLDQDGASLATLYEKAARYDEHRIGFVLVVKDADGGVFGAYLTEYPHPSAHYFGTGECFLWRAAVIAPAQPVPPQASPETPPETAPPPPPHDTVLVPGLPAATRASLAPLPPPSPSIRFSAFPYSGVNEYFIYCEPHSLSVGGGDGHYGLWLNDSLDKGISATCLTFGNQPLSDDGEKFGVLGVELWVIGSRR